MAATASLRERKKARTREALIEAAYELFEARGFESTTVDDVAAAADVSRRTFFRYFPTKEAVVFPDRYARLAYFKQQLSQRDASGGGFEAVRRACLELADEYMRDRANLVRQNRIVESSPILIVYEREVDREWEDALAEALLGGTPASRRSERRARVLAGAVIGAVRATLREWFDSAGRDDLRALGREALDWLAIGFAPRQQDTMEIER